MDSCWLAEAGVVPGPSWFATALAAVPLLLFVAHCLVRLYECNAVFVFRDTSNTIDLNSVSAKSGGGGGGAAPPSHISTSSSPDVVSLFAAISGCTFYVAAPLSLWSTSLELLVKFAEVGLFALMKSSEISVLGSEKGSAAAASSPDLLASPSSSSSPLLETALFGLGMLVVGFAVVLVFSLIYLFLQGLQVFHHVTLARLQRNRLTERRARIDGYRKQLLDLFRKQQIQSAASTMEEDASKGPSQQRRHLSALSSIARGMPADVEPPYVYPFEEGWFRYVLEPHYTLEVCLYLCITALVLALLLYAEGIAQLLHAQQVDPTVRIPSTRIRLTYLTNPMPAGGDFGVWGIPLTQGNMIASGGLMREMVDALFDNGLFASIFSFATLVVPSFPYLLFAFRLWTTLVPTLLVALFTLINLNTTAQEHREFWVEVARVVDLPMYNLIPGFL